MKTLTVPENSYGSRVDLFIMQNYPLLTRATSKKLIMEGIIQVNNEQVRPNYRLQEEDEVQIDEPKISKFLKESGNNTLQPTNLNLEILFEDENTLVINKPSGINSHPVVRNEHNSILNGLMHYSVNVSKENFKPRLVHRLDRDTSGVMLAAKTLDAQYFYSQQFKDREVHKDYMCIVHGNFAEYQKDKPFVSRSTNISTKKSVTNTYYETKSPDGRFSKTDFKFDRFFNKFGKHDFSLVKATPHTGRTHQIRVHISALGFPILGDLAYGGQKYKRMMLHAHSLKFKIYKTNEVKKIVAKLPEEFF